jgi:hypothetical protein
MDQVEKAQWCSCEPKVTKDGKEYPPAKKTTIRSLLPW